MIPRIIHQIWIGNQALRPVAMMETWRHMHPAWEYRLWTEVELLELGLLCGAEVVKLTYSPMRHSHPSIVSDGFRMFPVCCWSRKATP